MASESFTTNGLVRGVGATLIGVVGFLLSAMMLDIRDNQRQFAAAEQRTAERLARIETIEQDRDLRDQTHLRDLDSLRADLGDMKQRVHSVEEWRGLFSGR